VEDRHQVEQVVDNSHLGVVEDIHQLEGEDIQQVVDNLEGVVGADKSQEEDFGQ
jgi:hypothetical protein